jgi:NADH-quinone oxidoreductase subunit G
MADGKGNPPTAAPKAVRFKINGQAHEASPGTTIIQAAHRAGVEVPFFCYHPGLRPEGNCRMCLVEVAGQRKPIAACVTPVAENMEVLTESPMARTARKGVLELMLVNHPLDCPICDKSGECLLQDHTYNHGPDHSRMLELKEIKPTKDLGSTIALWGNRCIACTRCVRFCDEVAGTGELTMVNRGDHSVVDVFEHYPLENPLSMNTVDICPVGALISKDFLYQARVWYLKKQSTICAGCARGCNIEVQSARNEIKRLMPRHNPEVNDYWICDHGRFDFKHVGAETRLFRYRLQAPEGEKPSAGSADAARILLAGLRAAQERGGERAIAGVASAFMTLEELHLFRTLFETLGSPRLGAIARPGGEDERFPKFRIAGDKNPNRAGVEAVLGAGAFERGIEDIKDAIRGGEVRGLLMVADLPGAALDDEWVALLDRLDFAALFVLEADERFASRWSILPATVFAEKTGTMINEDGRVQCLRMAVAPPRQVRFEHEVFQEMLVALGQRPRIDSADAVFLEIGERRIPELRGKSHGDVGDHGIKLEGIQVRRREATGARV